jgi:hypothetical protein
MFTKLLLVVSFFAFVSAPAPPSPGICEDINALSNAWNDVANFMSENGDEQISDSDFMTLKKSIDDLK